MTTNKLQDLPGELIRPGRIDRVFTFVGVKDAEVYIDSLVESLDIKGFEFEYGGIVTALVAGAPQAGITKIVLEQAREYLTEKG